MHQRARTDPSGGRGATRVPTGTQGNAELARLLPQIIEAQKQGLVPKVDPILFHYMMVSFTATLSEFGPEMQVTSGVSTEDPKVVAAYWRLVDKMIFGIESTHVAKAH